MKKIPLTSDRTFTIMARDGEIKGVATLVRFVECEGLLMAPNVNALRKLARGFYLAEFDPTKSKRVKVVRA